MIKMLRVRATRPLKFPTSPARAHAESSTLYVTQQLDTQTQEAGFRHLPRSATLSGYSDLLARDSQLSIAQNSPSHPFPRPNSSRWKFYFLKNNYHILVILFFGGGGGPNRYPSNIS